jgi:hypothetical protein
MVEKNGSCREQIRWLRRMVVAGSRVGWLRKMVVAESR